MYTPRELEIKNRIEELEGQLEVARRQLHEERLRNYEPKKYVYRETQRQMLVDSGFPFATDEDLKGI